MSGKGDPLARGIEPVSPALARRFLTTGATRETLCFDFCSRLRVMSSPSRLNDAGLYYEELFELGLSSLDPLSRALVMVPH